MSVLRLLYGFVAMLLIGVPGAARADALALVIGNDSYDNVSRLKMARADARGYAAMFEARGFRVVRLEDADGAEMRLALARFYESIAPGDTVAFVYAGHGWSNGTNNYLLPTDIGASDSQAVITAQSFDLRNGVNGIIDEIHRRGPGLTLAVIDACRDNPFRGDDGTRAVGMARGLARVSAPSGTFIAFSAGEGQTALDRLSDGESETYSVFTRHFLRELAKSQDLQSAFKATQLAVNRDAQSVGHRQRPAYYDEVIGEVCLPPGCEVPVPQPGVKTTPSDGARAAGANAAQEWQDFKTSNSITALTLFADRHAGSPYAALARERIKALSAAPAPPPKTVPQQSFARPAWCGRAATATELAICSNPLLAGYDIQLQRLYDDRKLQLDRSGRRRLAAKQKRWLVERDRCGGDAACLTAQYRDRLARINQ